MEVAGYLITELLKQQKPMTFTEICGTINKRLNESVERKTILNRLRHFSDHFDLYESNGVVYVKLITNVSLCECHCSKSSSCTDSSCSSLHLCKFYALEGKCNYGLNCRYGHDLKSEHNARVLQVSILGQVDLACVRGSPNGTIGWQHKSNLYHITICTNFFTNGTIGN